MNDLAQHPENPEVDVEGLPDYRAVSLQPVAPGFVACSLLASGIFWLIAALIVWVLPRLPFDLILPPEPVPLLIVIGIGVLSMVRTWLDARMRGWAVREHDLIYRSGVLWRRTTILPFARIQHVESVSGPLERRFGLMRLKCFTAGGSGGDLLVQGLDAERARRVRAHLLGRIRDEADGTGSDDAL
jgi:membrane protein YdbS with pleckstrin-like domain